MNRLCWWLVNRASRLLDRNEQDAAQGDFAELGLSGPQALGEVLGLLLRRQAALWKDWRPWLALFGIAGLVGVRLGHISLNLSGVIAFHLETWWKYGTYYKHGMTLTEDLVFFGSYTLAVIAWSWTSGFVFGSLSRRTLRTSGALFLLVGLLSGPSRAFDPLQTIVLWTFLLHAILFPLPFFLGLRDGSRTGALGRQHALLWAFALALITAVATWTSGWQQNALEALSQGTCCGTIRWPVRLLPFVIVSWPVAYMVATARSRRWSEQNVAG